MGVGVGVGGWEEIDRVIGHRRPVARDGAPGG